MLERSLSQLLKDEEADTDRVLEMVLKRMGVNTSAPATWKPIYHNSISVPFPEAKLLMGHMCTRCGKYSLLPEPACTGCKSEMQAQGDVKRKEEYVNEDAVRK